MCFGFPIKYFIGCGQVTSRAVNKTIFKKIGPRNVSERKTQVYQ
jgi:hypothetical protein